MNTTFRRGITLLVILFGATLFMQGEHLWGKNQKNNTGQEEKEQEKSQDYKGQSSDSPYFSMNFLPLPTAKKIEEKALSFIGAGGSVSQEEAKNKRTFSIFTKGTSENATREAEIFSAMFPEPTLRAFRENQQKLVAVGVMAEKDVIPLTTEGEVEQYIRRRFESYLNEPSVSSDEKVIARRAIARLPEVMQSERARAERILRGESAEKVPSPLASLLSLSTPVAQAMWYTLPDCYKDDNPFSMIRGYTNISTCCNCGYHCSDGCTYFPDCGVQNVKCNVPQGCLNLECGYYQNAIWDSMTGICGCG